MADRVRKPEWLKINIGANDRYTETKRIVDSHCLHTICSSGRCPNMGECWGKGTATFMIGGDICTRSCKFCNTQTGRPHPLDANEPTHVAESIALMKLDHAVVTSVDRDDLPDLGAGHWAHTIREIKRLNPQTTIEVLIPDFQGRMELVDLVIEANPDIISHNMETVRRISPLVRSAANYDTSLQVIGHIARSGTKSKSGIMVGLGETPQEVETIMDDLLAVGCQILTIGQYLQPTHRHYPVAEYVTPQQFATYKTIGLEKGFSIVESAPLVRSSYHAEKHIRYTLAKKEWEEVMKLIRIIIMKGRQAGYFIILACQRPDAKYLGDGVRDQFGFRVALGSMSASGYTMMFGSIDKQFKEKDIAGRGYVNTGNGVVTEFYAPYVDPGYDFFAELSRIYEKRQQEGEACDRMYENGSETAGEE